MNNGEMAMMALYAINIGVALAMHGKPKQGNHSIVTTIIAIGLSYTILRWAGLFGGFQ